MADKVAGIFVPVVLIIATLVFVTWMAVASTCLSQEDLSAAGLPPTLLALMHCISGDGAGQGGGLCPLRFWHSCTA